MERRKPILSPLFCYYLSVDFQIIVDLRSDLAAKISPALINFIFYVLQYESDDEPKKRTIGNESMLVARIMKELHDNGHADVRPGREKEVTGPDGLSREVDVAAIADECAIVVLHRNLMNFNGAVQLVDLVNFIK